ncbi:fatty alcohol:caffeoyl-CoA acyltransferase-like [Salvia hispanica]|uniref:fatty alcohol:caffeoyl-CoA acyltransferase-like n=1 Tax=Salvia hispanica TaxID=49212 RepID=UPI002008F543|nr:fatty alcohol:caffeoyl-CoA acyltransferase-like [Salvia hispanica]
MTSLSPIPTYEDLKIKIHESSLVSPSQKTPRKSIYLSNIDQILNYNIPTAHFFKKNPDFPHENVAKKLKIALQKVLVPYDFMAGRIELNLETGRLEVDCNGAGVGFVVASSEFSLEEMGDFLVHPNLGYRQLAVEKLENLGHDVDQPLCVFQITSFKCGGFAIGMSTNHILLDGMGAKAFMENLASQAFDDGPLAVVPCNDRRLLAARSPPKVVFPHHEYLALNHPTGECSGPPVYDCEREKLNFRIFKLSPTNIYNMKVHAKNTTNQNAKISTFKVAAALMWRCHAFSGDIGHEKEEKSTILTSINLRSRVIPNLPSSYSGNGVLPIGISTTFEDLEKGPFSRLVELISNRLDDMTEEYAKSAFDWLEVHRGLPHGDYLIASWIGLGFDEVEYPWGKPIYCCPVVNHRKDICWVFRDAIDDGVAVMVALPAEEMVRFEALFYEFFR